MADEQGVPTPEGGIRASFDPSADHQQRPKLRAVRGFPVPANGPDGKQVMLLGLADASQISPRVVATDQAFQVVIPLMDGSRDLDQIVTEVGRGLKREMLESFVAQLDAAALIEGPPFDALLSETRAKFDESDVLPPGSTAQFADMLVMNATEGKADEAQRDAEGPGKLREALDTWMNQAAEHRKRAPLESLPKAIIAPHIDYPRGWVNYAVGWGALRGLDAPDRVVILGTNHFGRSSGICLCDKGFQSPLGTCPVDRKLLDVLTARLGNDQAGRALAERYDHEHEHSIELQIPWIQHVFGVDEQGNSVPVLAALIHDPSVNNGDSYDGEGVSLDTFVDALKAALEDAGGRTLIVSSADLSHVGPAFGDQQKTSGEEEEVKQFRQQVSDHDKAMLDLLIQKRPEDLIGQMAWQQNPTRWCSVGNMVAAMRIAEPETVEIMSYVSAADPNGSMLVSSASGVMT